LHPSSTRFQAAVDPDMNPVGLKEIFKAIAREIQEITPSAKKRQMVVRLPILHDTPAKRPKIRCLDLEKKGELHSIPE